MDVARKRSAERLDDGPRKAQRTSEAVSGSATQTTLQHMSNSENSISQVLQEMEERFEAWDSAFIQSLKDSSSGFGIENKAILNNLREDFMGSDFAAFKKRVTNIVKPFEGGKKEKSTVAEPSNVTDVLRNLQAVQEFLLANNGSMAPPAGPSAAQLIPGLVHTPYSSGHGGLQEPLLKQESPAGPGSSSYTIEDEAETFLRKLDGGPSGNPNPVPTPAPYLPYVPYPQPGYWFPNVPQQYAGSGEAPALQRPASLFPPVPPANAPRHPSHAREEHHAFGTNQLPNEAKAITTPDTLMPLKKPSPLLAVVCPFDLLGKPCPREDRGHRKYPCNAKKVCKRHPNCRSQYCGDVHLLKTCKSFVHNGKCDNGGPPKCKFGHDHVAERRQVADKARAHEQGVRFIPSSGQMRGAPGGDVQGQNTMGGGGMMTGGGSSLQLRSSRFPNDGRLKGT